MLKRKKGFREKVHRDSLDHTVVKTNYGGFSLPSATSDRVSVELDVSPFLVWSIIAFHRQRKLESCEIIFLRRAKTATS